MGVICVHVIELLDLSGLCLPCVFRFLGLGVFGFMWLGCLTFRAFVCPGVFGFVVLGDFGLMRLGCLAFKGSCLPWCLWVCWFGSLWDHAVRLSGL